MSPRDFTKTCFIVMPYGRKPVGPPRQRWLFWKRQRVTDFDHIYKTIFKPAIETTRLPEGGTLEPYRADETFYAGSIGIDMFEALEYSRFVLGDISSVNANVFLELGVRYRARESGTALFRQVDVAIPFDIAQIRAFPYEYEPEKRAKEARGLVTRVLSESLRENRLDSPVMLALREQRAHHTSLESVLRSAEDAIRAQDRAAAIRHFEDAVRIAPNNPLLAVRLGLLLKEQGRWEGAREQFNRAARLSPTYADAHREKGIAENKLYEAVRRGGRDVTAMATGEASLRTAITLSPDDFDALASLGGLLKREGRFEEAFVAYRRATDLSNGNSYPLLNEIKLQVRASGSGEVAVDPVRHAQLERAARARSAQVVMQPPYDAPWSFFDLAEIRLYLGDEKEFLRLVREGIKCCTASWHATTFRDSLQLLVAGGVRSDTLATVLTELDHAAQTFPEPQ
jgi:Flp pilus assembly protein TadD